MKKPVQVALIVAVVALAGVCAVLYSRYTDASRELATTQSSETEIRDRYGRTIEAIAEIQDSLSALALDETGASLAPGSREGGAANTEDALAAFRAAPDDFDLVVTDMTLIGTTGLQVAAEMLSIRPGTPIVLSSGHIPDDLREQAQSIGIRDVLYKPSTMAEFGKAVARLLEPEVGE